MMSIGFFMFFRYVIGESSVSFSLFSTGSPTNCFIDGFLIDGCQRIRICSGQVHGPQIEFSAQIAGEDELFFVLADGEKRDVEGAEKLLRGRLGKRKHQTSPLLPGNRRGTGSAATAALLTRFFPPFPAYAKNVPAGRPAPGLPRCRPPERRHDRPGAVGPVSEDPPRSRRQSWHSLPSSDDPPSKRSADR